MIDRPRISVIVPTFRRPEHLRHCLDGLAAQSYPRERFEVIVVDDGSGDPPLETVARCSGTLDVRLLQPPHSGPASARNAGARQARGDLLAFLDDDCIPDLNWLVELDAAASTTTGAAVGGRILNARPEQLTTEATHLVVEGFAARANADPDDALFCASSNAAFPSAGFRRIGGFDETFTGAAGEDRDLCGRWRTAGGRIVLAAGATVRHDPPPGSRPFLPAACRLRTGRLETAPERRARRSRRQVAVVGRLFPEARARASAQRSVGPFRCADPAHRALPGRHLDRLPRRGPRGRSAREPDDSRQRSGRRRMMLLGAPRSLTLELTNACDLRCTMCGIWRERPHVSLPSAQIEAILSRSSGPFLRLVALTGGEPFLLADIDTTYRLVRRLAPRAHVNFSTNGQQTARILALVRQAEPRRTSLTISYDGLVSHDRIRGVEGSAEKLLESAKLVRRDHPGVGLSMKMTITSENHAEMLPTAQQCLELGIPLRFKALEKLRCHQSRSPAEIEGPDYSVADLASIRGQAIEILRRRFPTNRRYLRRLIAFCEGKQPRCACSARDVFVGVDGEVFLCRKMDPVGNVTRQPFDTLWRSPRRAERALEMRACPGPTEGFGFTHE